MTKANAQLRRPLIALGAAGMALSVVLALEADGLILRKPPLKEVILAVCSAAVLAAGMSIPRPRPKDGERTPPQLAGETCAGCGQKIVMEPDGTHCAICKQAVHVECRMDHEQLGHREDGTSAYR